MHRSAPLGRDQARDVPLQINAAKLQTRVVPRRTEGPIFSVASFEVHSKALEVQDLGVQHSKGVHKDRRRTLVLSSYLVILNAGAQRIHKTFEETWCFWKQAPRPPTRTACFSSRDSFWRLSRVSLRMQLPLRLQHEPCCSLMFDRKVHDQQRQSKTARGSENQYLV